MRTVIIIQARLSSTRLPNKVLLPIAGKPMLERVVERCKQTSYLVCVAISFETGHEELYRLARKHDAGVFLTTSPISDLARRYRLAAEYMAADFVIRVPGDNPCVDPVVIHETVDAGVGPMQLRTTLDQDVCGSGRSGGLGCELYSYETLKWLDESQHNPCYREHPHSWFLTHGSAWSIPCAEDARRPDLRFDVNTAEDLQKIRDIYYKLGPDFRTKELLSLY